mgnify:CR=1 FL=1
MKLRPAYLPLDATWPFAGVDVDSPSTAANPRSSPASVNTNFLRGYLRKRRGYSSLGPQLGTNVLDPVVGVGQFATESGTVQTVAITTKRQYKLLSGSWSDITPGTNVWTASETDGLQLTVGTDASGRYLYATNGKNKPRRWDGAAATFEDMPCNLSGFVTCKSIAVYADSLVIGNITSAGAEPQTVAWSDTAAFGNFTSGASGSALLPDARGAILRLEPLGDRLVIYAEDSIGVATYIGPPVYFAFETLVTDTRLLSGQAVCNAGLVHFYAGRENVYAFDGTRVIRPVGDPIRPLYRDALALDQAARTFAFHDANDNRAWFVIPTSATASRVFVYEYDRSNPWAGRWAVHDYAEYPSSMGYFQRSGSATWDSLTGSWAAWAGTWGSLSTRAGFPVLAMGVRGFVRWFEDSASSDGGTSVTATWESIDYTPPPDWPGCLGRWLLAEIEARGSAFSVSHSTDRGRTWSEETTYTLGNDPQVVRYHIDQTAETCRLKIRAGGSDTFEVRTLRVGVRYGGVK